MTPPASTPTHTFPQITGYLILEQLYLGSRTAVYRAVQLDSQRPVVIKVLRREYPSFGDLVQFRNQYTITKNLAIPGIVQPLSLEPWENGFALVMEDFGGIALGQYAQSNPLPLTEVLEITLQVADILHELCQRRVVHKDIKPANILIQPESKQIKLIDFSIASLLPKETQEIQSPNILEGTLAYLAPEQTGRMNRGIDYRADFYALGVTLYQLLTGILPFDTSDPLELMHCHMAKVPLPVDHVNPRVPAMVAEIVSKLMEKNAEDRYQSAIGLKFDLEQCLNRWEALGAIPEFELGQRDFCDRFLIPEKLYGRETEVETLLHAFDRVAGGTSELMLVAGFSGIGKTAVINEVHKPIVRQRGYFIKGKFEQFNRNIPLSAFVQAFRRLMQQLLGEPDTALTRWKTQILAAMGDNGQVMIDVIPELAHIIGQQPDLPELTGSAAQNRFNLLFGKFIRVFTTKDHPLVIFLDDLQWADSASLNLLKLLMQESDTGHLLLLGAYRDNEVFPAHPLMLALDDIVKQGTQLHTLTLSPLGLLDITRLVADTLRCSPDIAAPLAQLAFQKTKGNPFFTTQFLQGLHHEGYITFDATTGHWQCDLAQVRQLSLTDDVVEFMVKRLRKLPEETQFVLKLAACIGNRFDLETLTAVCDRDQSTVAADLWQALQEGLIIPENETYKFFQGNQQTQTTENIAIGYHFLHDRVQQAAYALIPDEQKMQVHLKIGHSLVCQVPPDHQEDHIFEIVNHLNMALGCVMDETERKRLIRFNLLAAHKAHQANAYTAALNYAQTSIQLMPDNSWDLHYELILSAYLEAAEAAYLNFEFDLSIEFIQHILTHAPNLLDRIKAYAILIHVKIAQGHQVEAIQLGLDALSQLNVPLRSIDLNDQSSLAQLPRLEFFTNVVDVVDMVDPAYQAALRILITITPPVHHTQPDLYPSVALTMLYLCLEHGHSCESAFVYGCYGVLFWAVIGDFEVAYQVCQVALKLLERYPAKNISCKVHMLFGVFVCACKDPGVSSLQLLQKSIQIGQDVGDIEHVSYSMMAEASFLPLLGSHLDSVLNQQSQYLHWLQITKQSHALDYTKIWISLVNRLINQDILTKNLVTDALDDAELLEHLQSSHNHQSLFALHLAKTIYAYLLGAVDDAVSQAAIADQYADGAFGFLMVAAHHFYASLALLAQYSTQSESQQTDTQQTIQQNQQRMRYWADCAPCNFQHKYDLIEAERSRIGCNWAAAIAGYDRAIAGAKENGYLQESALANELAAKCCLEWGKERIAQEYLIEAYYDYAHWGAIAKVIDLEQRYPKLLSPILQPQQMPLSATETMFAAKPLTTFQSFGTQHSSSGSSSISSTLDLATVLKASQSLSSEIQLDKLLATLLHTVLENAGADRGLLLMPQKQEWFVEAVAEMSQLPQVKSIAFADYPEISHQSINHVKRCLEPMVIDDATVHPTVASDPYVMQQQPKSLLCTPILRQGKLVAILYLENQITVGAFTSDRVELLNFLCAQVAISLENARLYSEVQTKQRQLSTLLSNLAGMAYSCANDADWTMQFVSEGCFNLTGYMPEELINNRCIAYASLINPADADLVQDAVKTALTNHCPFQITYRIQTKQGGEKWVWEQGQGVFDSNGNFLSLEGFVTDISDRKAAEMTILEKSQALEHVIEKLQNTQLQMVQSEKMASLGNLVAGVAHEINNPIGFLTGSITNAKDYVTDLLEHLQLYQQHADAIAVVQAHADEIDLEFVTEDLPKLLDSMQGATDRIRSISKSLRTFSRMDTEQKARVDLHEGIESTLLILKYRLKANEHRPAIEIIREYGDLPPIKCFPGQLNQVVMNILANAIDVFDEMAQNSSFTDLQQQPQIITIQTTLLATSSLVEIRIRDNGRGMTEDVRARVFDHLFTTKGVGKGTGLGLAIARQIVVEQHGGQLDVQSAMGQGSEFLIRLPI